MSGISTGSIFFTPAMMMLSMYNAAENMVKATGKCVFAGAIAVHNYNKKRETMKIDKLSKNISELNDMIRNSIYEQTEKFDMSIEKMTESLKSMHIQMAETIKNSTADDFKDKLRQSEKHIMSECDKIHDLFQKNYHESINKSNSQMVTYISNLRQDVLNWISKTEGGEELKNSLAKSRAEDLLKDAEELMSQTDITVSKKYIAKAREDILSEHFQSAISLATTAITEIYLEMYKADSIQKEKEYYKNSIIFMIAEIKEYINLLADTEYTDENKKVVTVDLTQFMEGKDTEIINRVEEAEKTLYTYEDISSAELRKMTENLNSIYIELNESIRDAFYLMTYSLNKLDVEKKICNILSGKGFNLEKTLYTDGDPVKSSQRTYVCPLTGEELVISMIPYTDYDDELKTDIIIENNNKNFSEETREQYRKDIVEKIGSYRDKIMKVTLKCKEDTKNKNASEISGREVIENPCSIAQKKRR